MNVIPMEASAVALGDMIVTIPLYEALCQCGRVTAIETIDPAPGKQGLVIFTADFGGKTTQHIVRQSAVLLVLERVSEPIPLGKKIKKGGAA